MARAGVCSGLAATLSHHRQPTFTTEQTDTQNVSDTTRVNTRRTNTAFYGTMLRARQYRTRRLARDDFPRTCFGASPHLRSLFSWSRLVNAPLALALPDFVALRGASGASGAVGIGGAVDVDALASVPLLRVGCLDSANFRCRICSSAGLTSFRCACTREPTTRWTATTTSMASRRVASSVTRWGQSRTKTPSTSYLHEGAAGDAVMTATNTDIA